MKLMKNTLLTVSKMIAIAIGDRKATIAIAIGNLFSNGDRDRDLKFDQDRDRDCNFRDRGHDLRLAFDPTNPQIQFNQIDNSLK